MFISLGGKRMKDYTLKNNMTSAIVTFSVDEDWLNSIKIRATESIEEQVYNAAMADPAKSHITTDDDELNASIEEVKELVGKVNDLNKDKNSDIRIVVEKAGVYTVRFAGQIYSSGLRLKDAQAAVDKIKAYLDHHNMVKVRIFEATGKTALQRAMDLEAFIANKAHKVISVADNGSAYTLVYIEKGSVRNYNTTDDCDWDEE